MALGLIFGGCIILIYQKMKLQSKNYEILNQQKLRKKKKKLRKKITCH